MNKSTLNVVTFICMTMVTLVQAQIGIGTPSPDAQLDIRSSNQAAPANNDGILIPKVDVFPATNPTVAQQGMLVYLTTATTFGGNPKPIGFYYWNDSPADWIGISSAANGDHDWYEVGTTTAPNAITDNMFHTGNVAIGKNTATSALDVSSIGAAASGIVNILNSTVTNGGAISKFGINNTIQGSSDDGMITQQNVITSTGNGDHLGVFNALSGNGTGAKVGVRSQITSTNSGGIYGVNNIINGGSASINYGSYSTLFGTSTGAQHG